MPHLGIRHAGPDARMGEFGHLDGWRTHESAGDAWDVRERATRKSISMSAKNTPFPRETRVFFDFRGKLRSEKHRKMQVNIQGLSSEFRIFRDRGNRSFFRASKIRFFVPRKIGVFRDF